METSKFLKISSERYKEILATLNKFGGESRLVGGSVRDAILGLQNPDIDIATSILPNHIISCLTKAKIKVIPTGIKFGTVTAYLGGEKFEITTLRRDLDCSGRYAKVEYTDNFEVDAKRRDFTINALSYCPFENIIYDYFSGLSDLEARRVRFIGSPAERIKEDYLRILRFFRFSAYYSKNLDEAGYNACKDLTEGLKTLSRERIKMETDKILASDNCTFILSKMSECGILKIIFNVNSFNYRCFELALTIAKELSAVFSNPARYALLFHELNYDYNDLIKLKFSKADSIKILDILKFLKNYAKDENDLALKKIWLSRDNDFTDYIIILAATGKIKQEIAIAFIKSYKEKLKSIFPVNGHDVKTLGILPKEIKNELEFLKDKWIASDFSLTKHGLLEAFKVRRELKNET